MRRTRIESFKTWRGGFTYLIIRKGLRNKKHGILIHPFPAKFFMLRNFKAFKDTTAFFSYTEKV